MIDLNLNSVDKGILKEVADLYEIPSGAFNIRRDGKGVGRQSSKNIIIEPKLDNPGIDIRIAPGTKGEDVHIPVILTQTGLSDLVYNDFYVGEGADVLIIAGCGIHNDGCDTSQHDGVHTFHVEKNAHVRYVEKHYGEGSGTGDRILNPVTNVLLAEGARAEMEMVQIRGVTSTVRATEAHLEAKSELLITERLLTDGTQHAESKLDIYLEGDGSKAQITSRSVAKDNSNQVFDMRLTGAADCFGHIQCDSIIMGNARVRSIPELTAAHVDAQLIHEAAIGRIAGEQLQKMMTLGLTAEEAEERILKGFLK